MKSWEYNDVRKRENGENVLEKVWNTKRGTTFVCVCVTERKLLYVWMCYLIQK